MATNPQDFAFTYAGPSVAATFVTGVFNEQFRVAKSRLDKSDQLTNDALALIANAPQISEVDIAASLDIPEAPEIEGFSPSELTALYKSTSDEIKALLANGLSRFFIDYFPLGNELAAARAWVENAIVNGGTGLNPIIEAQIYERDRSRVLNDAMRATSEATAAWAARGYPMPPGALYGRIESIDQDARDNIAKASSAVAIKQMEIEIENTRFAVDKALQMRTAAISAAGDYIRTLALAPQLGVQLASSVIDAKAKLANVLTSFYQAKISALELPVRIAIADANADVEVRKSNLSAQVSLINARVATVEAAARAAGTQASAALNALNANTSLGGSEQV